MSGISSDSYKSRIRSKTLGEVLEKRGVRDSVETHFIAVMGFEWLFVASVMSGVAILMPTPQVFTMMPFWLDPATSTPALIHSIIILLPLPLPTLVAMDHQHLFCIMQLQEGKLPQSMILI